VQAGDIVITTQSAGGTTTVQPKVLTPAPGATMQKKP
jgi:hypothetical protein